MNTGTIDLQSLIRQYPVCLKNRGHLYGLLKDLYPEARLERNLIMNVYDCGIVDRICEMSEVSSIVLMHFVQKLKDEYDISESKGKDAIRLWAAALNVKVDEELQDVEKQAWEDSSTEDQRPPARTDIRIGSYVMFGHYTQSGSGNDYTPIEWKVLERDAQRALLLSRYALDCKPYNKELTDVTWEKCTLRTWLNNDFLNKAFIMNEQAGIETITIDNSQTQGDPEWDIDAGNDTQDKVFLLSYKEADMYFTSNEARRCAPTDYAIKNGVHLSKRITVDGRPTCWWMLRSPGWTPSVDSQVLQSGGLGSNYGAVSDSYAVRPAMWVNLAFFDLEYLWPC